VSHVELLLVKPTSPTTKLSGRGGGAGLKGRNGTAAALCRPFCRPLPLPSKAAVKEAPLMPYIKAAVKDASGASAAPAT
jgi:hypothetical protein